MSQAEYQFQIEVADYLKLVCPYPWSAIAHGGYILDKRTGAKLKAMGLMPGLADLLVMIPRGCVWLELKTPTGRQSAMQKAFQIMVSKLAGHSYHLCRSLDDEQDALESRGVKLLGRVA